MSAFQNPYSTSDPDRRSIWQMLIERDIRAFLKGDWSMVADDFLSEGFFGVHAGFSADPAAWEIRFPVLDDYRQSWLKQAEAFNQNSWSEDRELALFRLSYINSISFNGNTAAVNKCFCGAIAKSDGQRKTFLWQSNYYCRKVNQHWKIASFTGYLPFDGTHGEVLPAKYLPPAASQHSTAGPYSPVLIVEPGKLIVLSGQAAIDPDGNVMGDTIEEQTVYTLNNCRKALESAGSSMADVFKVNIFIKDLAGWPLVNKIYQQYFLPPLPVRTTVQTGLLSTLLIEIELWAIKK